MVVDVLRVQPGENLTEVLYTPATTEQEEEHQLLVRKREQSDPTIFTQTAAMPLQEVCTVAFLYLHCVCI